MITFNSHSLKPKTVCKFKGKMLAIADTGKTRPVGFAMLPLSTLQAFIGIRVTVDRPLKTHNSSAVATSSNFLTEFGQIQAALLPSFQPCQT